MQSVFPRDLEVLHDEHDHERRRGRDTTCNKGGGVGTCISCGMTTGPEPEVVRGLNENEDAAFIEWALNSDGGSSGRWDHTPLQCTRTLPPSWIALSMNALALQTNKIFSIVREQTAETPNHGMSSRWKVPNEILFLRVRQIHDHVFEDIREPWFDRKRLLRVSNAHPARITREDVFH